MSDTRRQKRKAIRESKKNLTTTKIDDSLAELLDGFLTDESWFIKQKELCDKLELEIPKGLENGYGLPIFNKNPITNEIEMHADAMDLFTAYQLSMGLASSMVGLDDESEEFNFLHDILVFIYWDPSFGIYLKDLFDTAEEKRKSIHNVFHDNDKEITERINTIINNQKLKEASV